MSTELFDRYAALDPVAEDTPALTTDDLLAAIDKRTSPMTSHDTISPTSLRSPRRALLVAAGVAVMVAAVVGALLAVDLGGGESLPAAPTPSVTMPAPLTEQERETLAVLDAYVDAFNSRDINGMMDLFSEDSALMNYKSGGADDRYGIDAIRDAFENEFGLSAGNEALTVSDISVVGSTVTFRTMWRTRSVGTWCSSDVDTVTVKDGLILTYEAAVLGGVPCN